MNACVGRVSKKDACRKARPILLLFSATLIAPTASWAAEWSITPSLTLSETYTDNVKVSGSGERQDEFITQINPAITLSGKGRRLRLDLSYNMQNVIYARNDDRNATFHQLRANALATLVDNALFLDMASSVNQQIISTSERAPIDNISISGNRTNTTTLHISPYFRHTFDGIATTELRYGYDKIYYDVSGFDSESQTYSAKITSGPNFKRVPWGLGYTRNQLDYSNQTAAITKFEMYTAELRYVATRKLILTASGGYENNEYESAPLRQKPTGSFWNAGIIWSPTARTSVNTSYGKRFFGDNYALNVNHHTRRSTWQVGYTENVTTMNLLQAEQRIFMVFDPSSGGVFVDPATGLPILVTVVIPTLTNEVFISKRLQASVGYNLKRNHFSLLLFNEQRIFERTGEEQSLQGANASWNLKFAPHSNLSVSGGLQHIEYNIDNRADDSWNVGATLNHDIQNDIKGSVEFRHIARDSSKPSDEYTENRIVARLTMTF